jgi:hypothetical protein
MADVDFLGTLAPPSGGSLPITRGEYIMGAVKVVANAAARDAIATTQLRTKDLCLLADTGLWYQWSGASWGAYTGFGGGGAGGDAFKFTFSTTTTDSDPGAGTLRFNSATPASITAIYVDDTDGAGTDITGWLASLDDAPGTIKGRITVQSISDPTKKLVFTMSAWTTATGYKKLTVAHVFGTALPPTSASDLVLSFDADPTGGDVRADGTVPLSAAWDVGNQAIDDVKSISYDGEVDNGNSSTADTIDWTAGSLQKSTLTGNCTYTFTAPPAWTAIQLRIVQDATGGRTVTWPGTVVWDKGYAPVMAGGPNAETIISGYYDGTNYRLTNPDRGVRIVTETSTTRTTVATDANALIDCTHASGCAVTIPPHSSVPYEIGTAGMAKQSGAAQVTLVAGAGVTLITSETLKTLKQHSVIGWLKLATNTWLVFGEREIA